MNKLVETETAKNLLITFVGESQSHFDTKAENWLDMFLGNLF